MLRFGGIARMFALSRRNESMNELVTAVSALEGKRIRLRYGFEVFWIQIGFRFFDWPPVDVVYRDFQ